MRRLLAALTLLAGLSAAGRAQAQPARVTLILDGGGQFPSGAFGQNFTLRKYVEDAPVTTDVKMGVATFVDAGLRLRVGGGLGIGVVGFSTTGKATGTVDARIPHPFYYGQLRAISGDLSGLDRTETGAHLELSYAGSLSHSVNVTVFGGPTYFSVEQALVNDVTYTESYPFDTAAYGSAPTTAVKETGIGYHAGLELVWKLSRRVGLAGLARYTTADIPLTVTTGNSVDLKAGGTQAGLGLRSGFCERRPGARGPPWLRAPGFWLLASGFGPGA